MLTSRSRRQQFGLSLVELMVGITVGLIVAAGASLVAVNQITEHRRLMLETQVQQDLRTAADLLQQDMRRAGFRGQADLGVWAPPSAVGSMQEQVAQTASTNPYSPLTVSQDGSTVTFLYAGKNSTNTPAANENFGFKWDKTSLVLYTQLGIGADGQPNWQPITDPDSLQILNFTVSESSESVSLGGFCDQPCDDPPANSHPKCPSQAVVELTFTITGQANPKLAKNVVRTLTGKERVRAPTITGACPP